MNSHDPKPEILRLEELALQVKSGDIKLPRFQRPFVWKNSDMLKLLDSIYKGYPIGSLLLWNSSQPLKSERNIAGLSFGEEKTSYPTNYLLDGQQRLTTLCGALFQQKNTSDSIWNIHFDLESEVFTHPKDPNVISMFPLNCLVGTSDFIRQCMKFEHHPNRDLYVGRAERLLRSIKDYKIAVVKIGDMSLEEVAPIFERINSTGRKLTMVDLMMAATWSTQFDLSEEIEKIKSACIDLGFDDITDIVILRSIAAAAELGINKEDIQKLRSLPAENLIAASTECKNAIYQACRFLRENTPVNSFSLLPYALQLTHLTEIFRITKTPSANQIKSMLAWFWQTSAVQYYRGANTGQNTTDLVKTRMFAKKITSSLVDNKEVDISGLLFDKFNLRNASSTAFTLLLLNSKPEKNLWGDTIYFEQIDERSSNTYKSVSPNILKNRNLSKTINPTKNKKSPIINNEINFKAHLFSEECVNFVSEDIADGYIQKRSEIIAKLVSSLGNCNATFSIPVDLNLTNDDFFDDDDALM